MAILKLSCKNQALEWENNSEEIIAGNIKIDKIAFEFCDLWDGFTKTAVFKKDDKALLVLLDDDCICEMPPEVTQTSGIVYIGVFGVKGDQKRTTEVKGLYLAEGVVTDGETPGKPTPDIYQQIVNLCADAVDTSKRVEAETKELNEQSKAVINAEAERVEAENIRQSSEEGRNTSEQSRQEGEYTRARAEEERQEAFEELKGETESLQSRMREGLSDFEDNSQQALDGFNEQATEKLEAFDKEFTDAITGASHGLADFEKRSGEALDAFATQSAEELEKVQTATDRANEAVDNMPNVYANALKGKTSGEVIGITDISPIEHNLDVKVSSKNLIKQPYGYQSKTLNGVEFTINDDGTVTANGTATATTYFVLWEAKQEGVGVKKGKTYTLSGCPAGGGSSTYQLSCQVTPNSIFNVWDAGSSKTAMANDDGFAKLLIYIYNGVTVKNLVFKPMLEEGTKATAYTPYVDDVSQATLSATGKNLIPYPYDCDKYKNENGVEFTVLDDGGIHIKGNATKSTYFAIQKKCEYGKSSISSTDKSATNGSYVASPYLSYNANNKILCAYAPANKDLDIILYPQIEVGTVATTYEPYIEPTSYTPNADGTVEGVKSIYPTTTLYTDTSGVLVECEYNRDINKAFAELTQAIIAVGGMNNV